MCLRSTQLSSAETTLPTMLFNQLRETLVVFGVPEPVFPDVHSITLRDYLQSQTAIYPPQNCHHPGTPKSHKKLLHCPLNLFKY